MHAPVTLQYPLWLLAMLHIICTNMCVCVLACKYIGIRDHAGQSRWRETCRHLDTAGLGHIFPSIPFIFHLPYLLLSLLCFFHSFFLHSILHFLLEMDPRTLSMLGKSSTTELQAHPPHCLVHREINAQRVRGACPRLLSKGVAFACDS